MPPILRRAARTAAVAGTATAVSGRVRHHQDQRWAQQEAAAAPARPAPAAPATSPSDTIIIQLRQLDDLRKQDALTDAQFASQASALLA